MGQDSGAVGIPTVARGTAKQASSTGADPGSGAPAPADEDGQVAPSQAGETSRSGEAARTGGTGDSGGAGKSAEADDEAAREGAVRSGLHWSVASQLAVRLVSVASGVVLLRILQPDQYGVYAFALAIVNILMAFNDLGQVLTIARWPGDVARAARTSTSLAWGTSTACFVGCFAAAPLLAAVTEHSEATGVLRLLCCLLLIDGVTTVPRALLFRDFRHNRTAIADLIGTAMNVVLALSLAAAGAGTWAPAIGTIGAAILTGGVVLTMAPSIPRPGWDHQLARRLLAFGFPLACSTLVELTLLNVDYLIVARQLGATALGLYAVAFNVSSWPSTLLTQAIRRVSVVGFAQLGQGTAALASSFASSFATLVTFLLPVCAALAVLSEPLLRFLYGAKLTPAAEALSWLVTLGGIRVAVGLIFDLLLSQGRSRATFRLQVVWLAAVIPALALGAELNGIAGVAMAHMVIATVIALPLYLRAASSLGVDIGRLGYSVLRPALGAVAAVAVGVMALSLADVPLVVLGLGGCGMVITYFGVAVTPTEARQMFRMGR